MATATPYIVGFPGKTYYEFDLSGEWTAKNTAETAPAKLDKQTISFVSEPGITIAISDNELSATPVDGYKFVPNYMSKVVDGYLMNADGNSFNVTPTEGAKATPFRPYFVADNAGARQYEHILSLRREADVRIVNMSGLTIANFTIQPGETVNTHIGVAGVYMVRADGGRIQKKLAVR